LIRRKKLLVISLFFFSLINPEPTGRRQTLERSYVLYILLAVGIIYLFLPNKVCFRHNTIKTSNRPRLYFLEHDLDKSGGKEYNIRSIHYKLFKFFLLYRHGLAKKRPDTNQTQFKKHPQHSSHHYKKKKKKKERTQHSPPLSRPTAYSVPVRYPDPPN